jgi:hypothetical protein
LPAQQDDEQRAEQRQEGDGGEDRPAIAHGLSPPPAKMNQVIKRATPISMTKA